MKHGGRESGYQESNATADAAEAFRERPESEKQQVFALALERIRALEAELANTIKMTEDWHTTWLKLKAHAEKAEAEVEWLRTMMREAREEIERDSRYHYAPAIVEINAPLALIQCSMEAKIQLLDRLERGGHDREPPPRKGEECGG